jgi:4-deoxy-L-threo-5-hexosulose-uronate ketol-isomerase
LYVRVQLGKTPLHVFNVHLGLNQWQRATQVRQVAEIMKRLCVPDEPVLLAGDFNDWHRKLDRVIVGGAKPVGTTLTLEAHPELRADFFLERRELGIINVGGTGSVSIDGELFSLEKLDCVYAGKGVRDITFSSVDSGNPALFYLLSSPAHVAHPTRKLTREEAQPAVMGDGATANKRTIYKYIHAEGIASAQLVMGLTVLEEGSVWNTMPAHTHTRRMEAYFYFDVHSDHRVFHFMGEPGETRHLLVANHDAVLSPPWSIHSGCGTANYGFIWGMAGENSRYQDMDLAPVTELR